MKIILLATVQHTGTWFMVEFLRSHPDVQNFVELQVLRKNETMLRDPISGQAGLVPNQTNLVQGHFMPEHLKLIQAFAATCPTIIPLRDPLLSLITRQHRHPELSHMHIVEAWLDLAVKIDLAREMYQPFYVPLDLLEKKCYRADALRFVAEHVGLIHAQADSWEDWIEEWSENWPMINSNPKKRPYPLRDAYNARDIKTIRAAIPEEWRALTSAEHILRPFLERVGYHHLQWWGDQLRRAAA